LKLAEEKKKVSVFKSVDVKDEDILYYYFKTAVSLLEVQLDLLSTYSLSAQVMVTSIGV
jgi:hypothetical protein